MQPYNQHEILDIKTLIEMAKLKDKEVSYTASNILENMTREAIKNYNDPNDFAKRARKYISLTLDEFIKNSNIPLAELQSDLTRLDRLIKSKENDLKTLNDSRESLDRLIREVRDMQDLNDLVKEDYPEILADLVLRRGE